MKRWFLLLLTFLPAVSLHAQEPLERALAAQDYPNSLSAMCAQASASARAWWWRVR